MKTNIIFNILLNSSLNFFSLFRNQQSEYQVLYELMCWLSVVVRSPPSRRPLSWIQSLLIDVWLLVTEVSTLSLILLTTQTMVLPLQGKYPMVEPGIEPGTSWLVVRSSDHQTTRLVSFLKQNGFEQNCKEDQTRILYSITSHENHAVYEIMWKNIYSRAGRR